MTASSSESAPLGLRERKKAKTRAAIQHEALRLFRQQGYGETTVEQIAEAVDVSPSTFFRYFPTKEDVVLADEYDPVLLEVFRAQPAELGPVEAFRATLRVVFGGLGEEEVADIRERMELTFAVPELRAAQLEQLATTVRQVTDLVAERVEGEMDRFAVHVLAGAVLGVMLGAELYWAEHPESDFVALLDAALAQLEAGLPV